ncbi:hypothetical protein NHQ30_003696 [Ciborinia camelliae]|nr:hypothetical protein NHQ30_003696 [Ciborinia camelliae]
MPQNEYMERWRKLHGRRLDHEERTRKKAAREGHKASDDAQKLTGLRAKLYQQKRRHEKIQMKKQIKAHEERNVKSSAPSEPSSTPLPQYLLDRSNPTNAKALSSAIKNKRAEKAAKFSVPLPKVRGIAEEEMFKVVKTGKKTAKKSWKRMITKPTFVGPDFTRRPVKYERFIRPMGLRYKKSNVTHPELGVTVQLPIISVKKNPQNPMYTQLGVLTRGTIIEVNVSDLGLVTAGGKVVWGRWAQITNNPENDGCVNARHFSLSHSVRCTICIMPLTPSQIEARELLAPIKFHQIFKVPATAKHAELKVSYAIAGPSDENAPTILFVSGMLAVRWLAFFFNHVAMEEGVRILLIDRPGFGGSTQVPLRDRISIYLETIPLLLKHLNIKHVSIASHSAGTIYALNIITRLPHIVCPSRPRITLLSPWVHQDLSSVTFLQIASILPDNVLNYWSSITNFIVNNATPTIASSGVAFAAFKSSFASEIGTATQREAAQQKCQERYGVSIETKKEMDSLLFKWAFLEDTTGLNDEARLCLKKTDDCSWDACEDYEEMVKNLVEMWTQRVERNQSAMLEVKIYLPEQDILIGEKGKEYFRKCWASESWIAGIKVNCEQLEGTDHDTVLDPFSSLQEIARTAKKTIGL